ncbi:helix-turn-helix domain-containing protein [Amycolatopsis sp. NPDC004368]
MKHSQTPPDGVPWLELQVILDRDGAWSGNALAEATGYSKEHVSRLRNGKVPVTPTAIAKFAKLLKVPYSVLAPSPRDGDVRQVDVDIEGGAAA